MSPAPALAGRVAIVTGAGRGLGREHALFLAREGARVVVNDKGGGIDGSGADASPAEEVVAEIRGFGGEAVANTDDVADWEGGRSLVQSAVDAFGDLHVLVNNAGIVRDRFVFNMEEDEWDDVVRVHLRGHFVTTRWASAWWRAQSKGGRAVKASVVNTTSTSGLIGQPGQSNYGAAKAAIASFTVITAAELGRRAGVHVNAVSPMARTRLTEAVPGWEQMIQEPAEPGAFDNWDPANVSPVVGWLATEGCTATGRVLYVHGTVVRVFQPWALGEAIVGSRRWTIAELDAGLGDLVLRLPPSRPSAIP